MIRLAWFGFLITCMASVVSGAEFQLRPQCQCRAAVVTLGDVADVFGVDPQQAEQLAAVELFPTPVGQSRYVRLREIQDILLARGLNLAEHRFSGAGQVMINGAVAVAGIENVEKKVTPADCKRASRLVHDAVTHYLQQAGASRDVTELDFQLTDAQTRAAIKAGSNLTITGGKAPWTAAQRFEVTANAVEGVTKFSLEVVVSTPPQIAVAAKSLPRGVIVQPEDVVLTSTIPASEQGDALRTLEEIVGRETTRTITEGKTFDRGTLRSPVMVRRGDVVTVFARSAGICVRTLARAREEGGVGDLISVESLQERKAYFARVSGAHEVEVYARATQADDTQESAAGAVGRAAAIAERTATVRR